MRKTGSMILVMCLALGAWQLAGAQVAEKTVTIQAADQAADAVAAQLTQQSGVQVGVVTPCTAKSTLDLTDTKLEAAVKAFAESIQASWMRAYVLESAPPATPYTADQLLAGLSNQRENWMNSFTDEERQALMEQWRGAFRPPAEGQPRLEYPGAGRSTMGRRGGPGQGPGQGQPPADGAPPAAGAPAEGAPAAGAPPAGGMPAAGAAPAGEGAGAGQGGGPGGGPGGQGGGPGGGRGGFMRLFDPVGQLILPIRTDTVTLALQDALLADALFDFTTTTGFILAAGADLQGVVNLDVKDKPINEVLDEIAKAANAKWRPIYLVSVPRELSEAEQEARQEQQFQRGWAQYWAKPKEERAQQIQQRVDRINRMAEMAKGDDERGQRAARRMQRMAPRMLSRLARYSATLTPEQRMELKPLLRAIGAAAGQQGQ